MTATEVQFDNLATVVNCQVVQDLMWLEKLTGSYNAFKGNMASLIIAGCYVIDIYQINQGSQWSLANNEVGIVNVGRMLWDTRGL